MTWCTRPALVVVPVENIKDKNDTTRNYVLDSGEERVLAWCARSPLVVRLVNSTKSKKTNNAKDKRQQALSPAATVSREPHRSRLGLRLHRRPPTGGSEAGLPVPEACPPLCPPSPGSATRVHRDRVLRPAGDVNDTAPGVEVVTTTSVVGKIVLSQGSRKKGGQGGVGMLGRQGIRGTTAAVVAALFAGLESGT